MIDPRGLGRDAGGTHAQQQGDPLNADRHLVTHPDVANRGALVDRQGDTAHGVREIHQEGIGAVLLDARADAEGVLDAAQRVEHRARASVLAVHLGRAVSTRNVVILPPVPESTVLGARDAEVGAFEGARGVGLLLENDG